MGRGAEEQRGAGGMHVHERGPELQCPWWAYSAAIVLKLLHVGDPSRFDDRMCDWLGLEQGDVEE